MSSLGGPSIVTSGLVLHLDAANVKSFKGEPTVNLVAGGGLVGMSGITLALISTDGVWKKYSMSGTFSGGTYPYIMYVTTNSFTGGLPYSTKCTILTNVLYKFNYFGTGINYVNQPMTNNGVMLSIMNSDDSRTVSRSGFVYTSTTSQFGYLLTNPINGIGFSPSTDFVWIKDLQVEQRSYTTPYVNGTRGTTVATGGGLADRSGNSNHGEVINGPTYNSLNGGSIVFDGVNEYISVPYNSTLRLSSQGSLSVWCYPTTLNQKIYAGLIGMTINGTPGGQSYLIHWRKANNTIQAAIQNSGVYNIIESPLPVVIGWYNFVFTWNVSFLNLYQNGISVATPVVQTINTQALNSEVSIGGKMFGADGGTEGYFTGYIPQTSIYNRALSSAEVLQNYDATKSRFI